jgi:hypothetical protein
MLMTAASSIDIYYLLGSMAKAGAAMMKGRRIFMVNVWSDELLYLSLIENVLTQLRSEIKEIQNGAGGGLYSSCGSRIFAAYWLPFHTPQRLRR